MRVQSQIRRSYLAALLALALPLVLLILLFDLRPRVPHSGPLNQAELARVEQIVVDNSPSRFRSHGERTVNLNTAELNLLADFTLENLPPVRELAARISLEEPHSRLDVSVPWRVGPLRWFLNLEARLTIADNRPVVQQLKAGKLLVPSFAQRWLTGHLDTMLDDYNLSYQELLELQRSIRHMAIVDDQLHMQLEWEPALLTEIRNQAQQVMLGSEDQQRLLHYYGEIHELRRNLPADTHRTSLHDFLPSLFASAAQRSSDGRPAAAENRALLQALAVYINNLGLDLLVADAPAALLGNNGGIQLTLQQRADLTRHFVTSAAISASAGVAVAELLANSKEMHDARHSSGFSFSDMTANMAGSALGTTAVSSEEQARQLQERLAQAAEEYDYMPPVGPGGDGLSEEEFQSRFGSRESPAFQHRLTAIEQLIARLPVHQE